MATYYKKHKYLERAFSMSRQITCGLEPEDLGLLQGNITQL